MDITEMNFTAYRSDTRKIKTTGDIKWGDCMNTSSILTRLIQEAGRYCNYYASDLFILWGEIEEKIEQKTLETKRYLFGFRESGVDGNNFILGNYKGNEETQILASYKYRSIWILDVIVEEDGKIQMELYEAGKIPRKSPDPETPWD